MKRLLLLCLLTAAGCTQYQPSSRCISLAPDLTDTMEAFISLDPAMVIHHLALDRITGNPRNGAIVRIVPVTNMRFTKERKFTLPVADALTNQIERKAVIDTFTERVQHAIRHEQEALAEIGQSAVFERLTDELRWLAQCTCSEKTLVLFSDMRQHNQVFDTYTPSIQKMLKTHPEHFDSMFTANYKLPDLLFGFTIHFVFQSKDQTSDQLFKIITDRLRGILEQRGAVVIVSGTLQL